MPSDKISKAVNLFLCSAFVALTLQLANMFLYEPMVDCEMHPHANISRGPVHNSSTTNEHLRVTSARVVYFVMSARRASETRRAIRNTWAKGHDNIYFVVGEDCRIHPSYRGADEGGNEFCSVIGKPFRTEDYSKLTRQHLENVFHNDVEFQKEMTENRDILLLKEIDSYRALPKKLKAMYSFSIENLNQAEWIVKVDDDFFVQIDKFSNFLLKENAFKPTDPVLIGGDIRTQNRAHIQGKWKEVPQFETGALYPPFPLGSYGHVVSRPIAEYISRNQDWLFEYQGEDVSLGIWLKDFSVKFATTKHMSNKGKCNRPELFVVGHDVSPKMMKQCHANTFGQ